MTALAVALLVAGVAIPAGVAFGRAIEREAVSWRVCDLEDRLLSAHLAGRDVVLPELLDELDTLTRKATP